VSEDIHRASVENDMTGMKNYQTVGEEGFTRKLRDEDDANLLPFPHTHNAIQYLRP
jgi:hypothetical protein